LAGGGDEAEEVNARRQGLGVEGEGLGPGLADPVRSGGNQLPGEGEDLELALPWLRGRVGDGGKAGGGIGVEAEGGGG